MKSKSLISIVTLMFASLASSSFVNPSNENPLSKNYVVKRASGDVYQALDAYDPFCGAEVLSSTSTTTSQSFKVSLNSSLNQVYTRALVLDGENKIDFAVNEKTDTATVFKIGNPDQSTTSLTLPNSVNVNGTSYSINRIADDAFKGVTNIQSVNIPSTISTIDEDAFLNASNLKVNFEVASKPATHYYTETSTSGVDIKYGQSFELVSSLAASGLSEGSSGFDYSAGYYGQGDMYKPLTVSYDIKKTDGSKEHRETTLKQVRTGNAQLYDGFGARIADTSIEVFVDIPLNEGEEVDKNSISLLNIFKMNKSEGSPYVPFIEKPMSIKLNPKVVTDYDASKFLDVKYTGASTFGGFTSVSCSIEVNRDVYKEVKKSMYRKNEEKINNGTVIIRTRFNALTSGSFFLIKYQSEGEIKTVNYPILGTNFLRINDDFEAKFIVENSLVAPDFRADKMVSFSLGAITYSLDLCQASTLKTIVGSEVNYRFADIAVFAKDKVDMGLINNDTISIVLGSVYTVLFVGVAVGLYFYLKNKYKNDEFRRMNTKAFIKSSIIAFVSIGILIFALAFISYRFFIMNNSLVAYNPLDPYVIFFGVALIIVIGYYSKTFVTMYKNHKAKVKIEKLKLNEDEDDDGTK